MTSFLKSHPFPVAAFFESTLVLTYAVPKEEIAHLLPPCLMPDTWNDKWAFIAVAMVNTKNLRPKGFPSFMGHDFFLTGYRIFARYTTSKGKRLRGLYILKSETDKRKMVFLGNIFTHYSYELTDIALSRGDSGITVFSGRSDISLEVQWSGKEAILPSHSPFNDWKEARRFAGPLPFTFSYDPKNNQVLIIEGVRENWTPRPVNVIKSSIGFIDKLNLKDIVLANAFVVHDIPYSWKKGKTDIWTQH